MAIQNIHILFTGDQICDPEKVNKVLVTSGKHYYTLMNKKLSLKDQTTAILRLESFSPFPTAELLKEIEKFKNSAGIYKFFFLN